MKELIRGEYFPQLSTKVLFYYGQLFCDPTTVQDGDIVYCDTHSILQFKDILNTKKDLTLITHNSDHYLCDGPSWNENGINVDELKCYKKWYGQNSYSLKENVIPIPIGFENTRWESSFGPKTEWIEEICNQEIAPTSLIYLNCNKFTNISERENCYNFARNLSFITVDEPKLSYVDYLKRIKEHKFVLSPRGNGLDCHRTWEVMMMKRVPILKREGQLERLYFGMPVLFVDKWEELVEIDLDSSYDKISFKSQSYLFFDFWKKYVV